MKKNIKISKKRIKELQLLSKNIAQKVVRYIYTTPNTKLYLTAGPSVFQEREPLLLFGTLLNPKTQESTIVTGWKDFYVDREELEHIASFETDKKIFSSFPTAGLLIPQFKEQQEMIEILADYKSGYLIRKIDNLKYLELLG